MYNAYFGFSETPFSLSPDPAFLYRSEQHEEALANLIYGVQSRKGFIVLTGEVGTGKTTMLECLRDFLDSQYIEFAFLFNSRINSDQFFEMIAYDLDLRCQRTSKTEVLFALNSVLLNQAEQGRTTVLIIDEAHNLEWEVLEEIRLLGNLENRRGKLLQIILAGQPELDRKLQSRAVHSEGHGPVHQRPAGKGRHARPDGVYSGDHDRDSRAGPRHPAFDQRCLRQCPADLLRDGEPGGYRRHAG
jgi:general secretion pathway protein A